MTNHYQLMAVFLEPALQFSGLKNKQVDICNRILNNFWSQQEFPLSKKYQKYSFDYMAIKLHFSKAASRAFSLFTKNSQGLSTA